MIDSIDSVPVGTYNVGDFVTIKAVRHNGWFTRGIILRINQIDYDVYIFEKCVKTRVSYFGLAPFSA